MVESLYTLVASSPRPAVALWLGEYVAGAENKDLNAVGGGKKQPSCTDYVQLVLLT